MDMDNSNRTAGFDPHRSSTKSISFTQAPHRYSNKVSKSLSKNFSRRPSGVKSGVDSANDEFNNYEDSKRLVPYYNMNIAMLQDPTRNLDLEMCNTKKLDQYGSFVIETTSPTREAREIRASSYDCEPFEGLSSCKISNKVLGNLIIKKGRQMLKKIKR